MFSERIYEKMYNGSRSTPALERGVTQADESRRRGVIMEAIAGVDIAVWDVKAQALGIPLYQALGAVRSSVRGYASGGWAPGEEAEAELAGYAAKGFTAAKMRVVGRDGFSIAKCVRRVKAARRGLGPDVELMVDAHGSLEVAGRHQARHGSSSPTTSPGSRSRCRRTIMPARPRCAAATIDPHRLGRARIHALRLPGPARAPRARHRAARRRPRRWHDGNPPHRRADLGARRAPCAARLGQRGAVRGEHARGDVGRQLPHP